MRTTFYSIATAFVALSVGLAACDGENNNKPVPPAPKDKVTLSNLSVTNEMVLDADVPYVLDGKVEVKKGGSLIIPAGTTITASAGNGFSKYILVEQGGKIYVNGTAQKPVKMTSDVHSSGAWGGLVINGYAGLNGGLIGQTEIDPSKPYGGSNDADNSGSITYLILEYTGAKDDQDVEHNGLTLNGVGNGTKIENIYIPEGSDDGIEFFGGSVNVSNLLVVNADDDMFDFTQGYNGTLTNAYGVWEDGHSSTEKDPRGIEADGNLDGKVGMDATRQSNFKVNGITIDLKAKASSNDGFYMHDVFKIRRGAIATITNALVMGQGQAKDLIDVKDDKGAGTLTISLNNQLSTPLSGKEVNGEATVTKDSSKGVDKGIFAWTGYKF